MIDFLLNQNATIKPFLRDGAGSTIYDVQFNVKCRVDTGKKLIKVLNKNGDIEAVVTNAIMFVSLDRPIPPKSIVEINNTVYKVINCEELYGFKKSHMEVYLE